MKNLRRTLLLAGETVIYILCSLTMINFAFSIFNNLGSTEDVMPRMLPYYLSFLVLIYLLFLVHLILFPKDEKKLILTYKVNGIILAVLALLAAVLVLLNVVKGVYHSFIIGTITPLFPLDSFLLDLVIMGIGIYLAIRGFRYKAYPDQLYFPYQHGLLRKIFSSFFGGLFLLFSMYLTGAFILAVFTANYGSPTWLCMLVLWLQIGVPGGLFIYHDWFYKKPAEIEAEKRQRLALIVFASSLILTGLLVVCLIVQPNFIVEDATGLFALDYMKSWNLIPFLSSLVADIPSLAYFLAAALEVKKNKKNSQPAA
jgi:hypothetical protein